MNEQTKRWTLMGVSLAIPVILVAAWASAAQTRLKENAAVSSLKDVAIASVTDDNYCTPQLKAIIRRVAGACGLIEGGGGGRGCQPMEAKKVAALSGDDFNAMFKPLAKRAHIIQFDASKTELDADAAATIEKAWSDQRGASFFFVVSRASTDGAAELNETLSRDRAKGVLAHLHHDSRFAWIDSCAESDHSMVNRLLQDRRTINKVLLSTGRLAGDLTLWAYPAGKWLSHLIRGKSNKTSPKGASCAPR